MCSKRWETMEEFLSDPELAMAGYQINFADLKGGLFYFSHMKTGCGTTMVIPVGEFTGLSDRPMLASQGKQPDCCPELCVRKNELAPCPAECECSWVREIMQVIRDWKKQNV